MIPSKLNTVLRFDDGRIGTVCYNCLDGVGGMWGVHTFLDRDNLPAPEWIAKDSVPSSLEGFDVEVIGHEPQCAVVDVESELAAFPDLLEELQLIVDGWDQVEKNVHKLTPWEIERRGFARAAIAKATLESNRD